MTGPPAVVVGLDCITGLQTARILRRDGVDVYGTAADTAHFACRSNTVSGVTRAPHGGEPLIRALRRMGRRLGTAMLIPCTDASVATISEHRDALDEAFRFVLPSHDVVMSLMDKHTFEAIAAESGVRIPVTRAVRTEADAARAAREMTFPAVLKPALKTPEWLRRVRHKALKVERSEDLLASFSAVRHAASDLLLQEWVEGPEEALLSCNVYFGRSGWPEVTFVARKLRQWPLDTGTSSLGEEVRDDEMLALTIHLLESVGYRGLGYVEAKRHARTGELFVIEPNVGRPTGRSAIAEIGGVPLVMSAYRDAIGVRLPEPRDQRYTGAKWIYFRHDLQSALMHWRRGDLSGRDWIASWRGITEDAVWSWTDPMPFVGDVGQTMLKGVRGAVGRVAGRLRWKTERLAS